MKTVNIHSALRNDRPKKNGECNIVIRIQIGRQIVYTESTGKAILPVMWDANKRCVKNGHPNYDLYNISIRRRIAEIESLIMHLQLKGAPMNRTNILRVLQGEDASKDFYLFCTNTIKTNYCRSDQAQTRRSYNGEVSKLKSFRKELCFADIDLQFLNEYKHFMITDRGNSMNTVWKGFKFLNTMLNEAIKIGGIITKNPMAGYDRGKYKQGERLFLEAHEVERILMMAQGDDIPDEVRTTAYYYLFMCFTGLRFEDAKAFRYNLHVINNSHIIIETQKSNTIVRLLIHSRLMPVLNYIKIHPFAFSNKTFNQYLKVVGSLAKIQKEIKAHSARHSFGSSLAGYEIPVEVAQKLLGHRDKRSTLVYYHMKDISMDNAMRKFDN